MVCSSSSVEGSDQIESETVFVGIRDIEMAV